MNKTKEEISKERRYFQNRTQEFRVLMQSAKDFQLCATALLDYALRNNSEEDVAEALRIASKASGKMRTLFGEEDVDLQMQMAFVAAEQSKYPGQMEAWEINEYKEKHKDE